MFRYCLNTGTISGQKLSLVDELKTASKAGFDSVEPWMREIHEYRKTNGSLKPLRECVADLGPFCLNLTVIKCGHLHLN